MKDGRHPCNENVQGYDIPNTRGEMIAMKDYHTSLC